MFVIFTPHLRPPDFTPYAPLDSAHYTTHLMAPRL
jgi:hypothetical protein